MGEGGRSRHADPYPEHLLPSRGKHGDRYPDCEPTETGRARGPGGEVTERVVRRKERPARPPPPQSPIERDKALDRERDRQRDQDRGRDLERERFMGKDQRRDREQDLERARAGGKDRERSRDRGQNGDRHRDGQRQTDRNRQRARTTSRERGLEEDPGHSRDRPREGRASWEEEGDDDERERRAGGRQRVHSSSQEVFDELGSDKGRGDTGEFWHPRKGEVPGRERCHTHPNETGTTLSPPSGLCGGVCVVCWSCFLLWLRWWDDLTLQSLMKTLIFSVHTRMMMIQILMVGNGFAVVLWGSLIPALSAGFLH